MLKSNLTPIFSFLLPIKLKSYFIFFLVLKKTFTYLSLKLSSRFSEILRVKSKGIKPPVLLKPFQTQTHGLSKSLIGATFLWMPPNHCTTWHAIDYCCLAQPLHICWVACVLCGPLVGAVSVILENIFGPLQMT